MERSGNKRYLLIFYASMGLGMLTKGLIAVVFPFGILFWYVALTKNGDTMGNYGIFQVSCYV